MKIRALILIVVLALAGCSPLLSSPQTEMPTSNPLETPSLQPETPTENSADAADSTENCAYVWDSRPLDLETNMVQAAFQAKGYSNVSVRLQAYGENCIDLQTNQIVRFAAMETDFYLTIGVDSLDDTDALGNQLAAALVVLRSFPQDTFPGLNPARVFVTFNAGGQLQNLSFDLQQAGKALDKGLTGSALLEAFGFTIVSPSATPAR